MKIKGGSMLEVVSLDFGGTIAYEAREDHVVYHEVLGELGYEVDVKQLKEAHRDAGEWWSQEKAKAGKLWSEETFINFIQHMLTSLMLPNPREAAIKAFKLWPYKMMFKAYEDVEPTLKLLKQRGYRLIIISNVSSNKNLSIYLAQIGLEAYFDLLVASGSVGYEKPDSKIFMLASRMLNVPPNNMMHVGDDYKADYLGAESAGLIGVLLDRKGVYENKYCRKLSSLTELPSLIDRLYG